MKEQTAKLIDSIASKEIENAQQMFNTLMSNKVREAIDLKRIEIASSLYDNTTKTSET